VLNMFRNEKGDGANLSERPGGCFAQISPVPFFDAALLRVPAMCRRAPPGFRNSRRLQSGAGLLDGSC
jgi:hypothetical protein